MNSMPLAVAHKESPAIAKGNTSAEFSYISHVLCAQICEMEALVKRVKLSDPTVKKHDLKMARLLPLKTIYAMLPRIEEIAPTMPEEDQSIVRGLEVSFLSLLWVWWCADGLASVTSITLSLF